MEMEVALLIITPSKPLAKVIPITSYSIGIEIFIPEGKMLPPGDTMVPLNWE